MRIVQFISVPHMFPAQQQQQQQQQQNMFPARSAGVSSCFRFMFAFVFQWFPGNSRQYSPCLPCLWHRAFPMGSIVHFLVYYSMSFLFIPRPFPFCFAFAFYVFSWPSQLLCVLTYRHNPCVLSWFPSGFPPTLTLHFQPHMHFIVCDTVRSIRISFNILCVSPYS